MLALKQIKALNIEMSSSCNGKCPFCSRDQKIRRYGNFRILLEDFKKLPETLVRQLKWISFAGNFGDLSSNPDMVKIAAYIKGLNRDVVLGGDTNGSMQSADWWASLGKFFRDGTMEFAVDGLADTHAVHRRGTDYNKIVRNIKAFAGAGGVAHWKFIVFRHNEHQIAEAEKEAERIGCKRFFVIPSRDYGGELQKPEKIEFQIKRDIFKTYDEKLSDSDTRATCKPISNGSLYLAADGTVHPCCFAHCMYITEHNSLFDFLPPLAAMYYDQINFKTTPLSDILKGPYFSEILSLSKTNSYCRMKCNPFRKTVKKELVLIDKRF
ncbi:radical SAM protein [Desulfospira joergensenii]|uniref:radical SAM protein n=1 Tax=Desulfospira joergensenii TaxID=53329 RepID=UPI0003B3D51F|nr:radical SAM protein [Desulfospira joergensenii]